MSPVSPERVKTMLCARSGAVGRSRRLETPGTVDSESRVS